MAKTIVLLTSGIRRAPSGKWRSDFDGHITYSAGAELYRRSKGLAKIVICGGKINGEENPVLSEVMKNELVKKYRIMSEDIYAEVESVDTSENAEYCKDVFEQKGLEKDISLVTRGYHMRRSARLFLNYGFKVEKEVAENIVSGISEAQRGLINRFRKSLPYAKKTVLNRALEFLLYLPYRSGEKASRNYIHREIESRGRRRNF